MFLMTARVLTAEQIPGLKVLPWNGHKAAASLTFDDGYPSHLDIVIPELDQRGIKASFYLIANRIERKDEWRKIIAKGHEIGNHTLDHRHPAEMTPDQQEAQVVGANHVLQKEFGVQLRTFAYPYTEVTPELKAAVGKTDLLARGGYGKSFVLVPSLDPEWLDIPSRETEAKTPLTQYKKWVGDSLKQEGWLVWRIHRVEESPTETNSISTVKFKGLLDVLSSKDIWVGTFLEVGSYFMGEKIFEKAVPAVEGNETTYQWVLPENFPPHVLLKVRPTGDIPVSLSQNGKRIKPDGTGLFLIDLDQKVLKVSRK
jgi:peptidoglycan/xylan/chitin deacetylase (PgdA/CDA1 family)